MNYFSHNPLNRFSEIRPNEVLLTELWNSKKNRVLLICDTLNLLRNEGGKTSVVLLSTAEAEAITKKSKVQVFLGYDGEVSYFVLGFVGEQEMLLKSIAGEVFFQDLKAAALQLSPAQSALLSYARAMVHWNLRHLFCSDCGGITSSIEAGHVRRCSESDCAKLHFPRTDTAVIMIIVDGDACLLGRQKVWPVGQYSALAGFLEPGETLEQAVEREAMEEAGVSLKSINYHSSQPWPFPASIMVGFIAIAQGRDIKVNYSEMEDARWFTRKDIIAGLKAGTFRLPTIFSISYRLISDWFNSEPGYNLEKVLKEEDVLH